MNRIQKWVVGVFVTLYLLTGGISTIHSIDFFSLANPNWLAITLAIAFEIGAMACLAAIIVMDKTVRWMVWSLFCLVTSVQIVGNMYYSYSHLSNFSKWSELFGLSDQEPMLQMRILSVIIGGIIPIVALGFIKSLVDVARPKSKQKQVESGPSIEADPTPIEDELEAPKPELDPIPPTVSESQPDSQIQAPEPDTYVEPVPPPRFGPM